MSEQTRRLIVGTGPTAVAAAMAFRRLGVPFEVVDVGYDLEAERESMAQTLSREEPSSWSPDAVKHLFPPAVTSANGVEKRLAFGSDFPYRRPDFLSLTSEGCIIDVSHGKGGFGNVWGAATLPYAQHDVAGWPFPSSELAESYGNVLKFMPSSAERDRLHDVFPVYSNHSQALKRSEQTENLLRALDARHEGMKASGIQYGRARVAVDASTCRYCGECLDGCVYGSIFNPRTLWNQLEKEGVRIHKGYYALEFTEAADGVTLTAINVKDGTPRQWKAQQLFVGAGVIATTRLVARSLHLIHQPIRILDSQYFFFPMLSYRAAHDVAVRFTLAEVFFEILNREISPHYIHFQVYGINELFRQTLKAMVPSPLRQRGLLNAVESRFYLLQGFLNSGDSGHLELTINASHANKDEVHIRGVNNPGSLRIAKQAQSLLRKRLSRFGFIPWLYLKMVPLGRSFHLGGSFPTGGKDAVFTSDTMGRPAGLQFVHLLDASTFPSIAASTITYTAMANADRVVRETHKQGRLA